MRVGEVVWKEGRTQKVAENSKPRDARSCVGASFSPLFPFFSVVASFCRSRRRRSSFPDRVRGESACLSEKSVPRKSIFVACAIERLKLQAANASPRFPSRFLRRTVANYPEATTRSPKLSRGGYFSSFVNNGDVSQGRRSRTRSNVVTMLTFTRDGSRSLRSPPFKIVSWMGHPVEQKRETRNVTDTERYG